MCTFSDRKNRKAAEASREGKIIIKGKFREEKEPRKGQEKLLEGKIPRNENIFSSGNS
jgi:hypothetical protein